MATYSNFQLETNRHSGQTTQTILKNLVIFAETAIKFVFGMIGDMIRMISGK